MTGVQTCALDRKSTRLNSSHTIISYAVFCLKKKNRQKGARRRTQAWWRRLVSGGARSTGAIRLTGDCAAAAFCATTPIRFFVVFFFKDTATPEIYPLPLHDPLPI